MFVKEWWQKSKKLKKFDVYKIVYKKLNSENPEGMRLQVTKSKVTNCLTFSPTNFLQHSIVTISISFPFFKEISKNILEILAQKKEKKREIF